MKEVALAISCLLWAAAARAMPFGFQLRPSSGAVIGAPFDLEGTAIYPERYALAPDLTGQDAGPFTVLKAEIGPVKTQGENKAQSVRLQVVPFETGALTFPALNWPLRAASGSTEIFKSPPVKIDVSGPAVNPEEQGHIRDIRPPIGPTWWPLLLLLAILAGTVYYAIREYRRRHPKAGESPFTEPADTRLPHEIALDALARLNYRGSTPKEYYDQLSDIVRLYLERRFGIPAMTLTTMDLLRQMREAELDRQVIANAKDLFDPCDLAKFAKFQPDETSAQRDRENAIAIIRATMPPPPRETARVTDSETEKIKSPPMSQN